MVILHVVLDTFYIYIVHWLTVILATVRYLCFSGPVVYGTVLSLLYIIALSRLRM